MMDGEEEQSKQIINLTPHEIKVIWNMDIDGKLVTFFKTFPTLHDYPAARITTKTLECKNLNEIPTCKIEYGKIENLPEPKENTYYIVSMLVGQEGSKMGRKDLIGPNTNEALRDEKGRIVGVPGFVRY